MRRDEIISSEITEVEIQVLRTRMDVHPLVPEIVWHNNKNQKKQLKEV